MSLKSITKHGYLIFIQIVKWLKLFQQFVTVSVLLNSQFISDNTLYDAIVAKILQYYIITLCNSIHIKNTIICTYHHAHLKSNRL